jgi:transcriptional regulator with XRE-family HTH domain
VSAVDDQLALRSRLREAREYLNLTQQYVSERTGIPRSAIAEIESGKRRVESTELKKLARVYLRPVSYFLDETEMQTADQALVNAFARAAGELTAADQQEVLRFAEFLRFQRKGKERE